MMATSEITSFVEQINTNILECSICLERLKQPKGLGCLHTFCLKCLEGWVKSKGNKLTCPTCGKIYPIPDGGIKKLPPNTFLESLVEMTEKFGKPEQVKCFCKKKENATNYCKDCRQYMCRSCSDHHTELPLTSKHKQISVEEMQSIGYTEMASLHPPRCLLHNKPLEFYCIDCKHPICVNCTIMDHDESISIFEAFKQFSETSKELMNEVKEFKNKIQAGLKKVTENVKILEQNKEKSLKDIEDFKQEMIKNINEKGDEMKDEVEAIYRLKKKASEVQIDELTTIISDINIKLSYLNYLLNSDEATAMQSSDKAIKALKDRMEQFPKTEPDDNGKIHFIKKKQTALLQKCDIGHVSQLKAAYYLSLQGDECVTQGQTIVAKIIKTDECKVDLNEVQATWTQPTGQTNITEVKDENGDYIITGECTRPGVCRLDVNVDGEPIKKSPMLIKVEKEGLFNAIQIHKEVRNVVKCEDDCLLVTCWTNEIYKYQQSGEYIEKITLSQGVMVNRMFIMKNGNIAFSDNGNKCIKICNMNGDVIKSIGKSVLKYPAGIHVDELSNVVYVADCHSHFIFIIDIDNGKIIRKIGSPGEQEGQLNGPIDVTHTKHGHVLVSELDNHRLQLFDNEGRFIKVLVPPGDENGKVMYPRGVVVDEDDNIIISSDHKLQLFGNDGNFMRRIDKKEDGINSPNGLCVVSHHPRKVAVANFWGKNVKIFNY